jgi:hypothetical protein
LSGGRFVDKPYMKTQIENQGDIVELTTEKFHYPEGYFAMDQPPLPNASPTPVIRPVIPQPAFHPNPELLKPTPSPFPLPSPSVIANNASPTPAAKPSPLTSAEDKSSEQAQKELEAASKKTGIDLPAEGEINKAPFKDLAAYATDLRNQGKLDFDKPFEVTIDTELDNDGKLVRPKVTKKTGDETLVDLGGRLVAAMNDSGVLFYLKKINKDKPGTKVVFTIKQEGNDVIAVVESEVASADSARTLSNDFGVMLLLGAASRKGKDEELLLRNTKVSADGTKVVFKLTMAHQDVVDIVKKGMAAPSPTVTPISRELLRPISFRAN